MLDGVMYHLTPDILPQPERPPSTGDTLGALPGLPDVSKLRLQETFAPPGLTLDGSPLVHEPDETGS